MRLLITALALGMLAAGCKSVPGSVARAQEATRLVRAGSAAAEKGDIDSAIPQFEKALDLVPNAPKYRFAYAELLYWKALSYTEVSHRKWQLTLGRKFVDDLNKWERLPAELPTEKKQELLKESAQQKREAHVYFNKALKQLMRCDIDFRYGVPAVPFAMGMIYVFTDKYDDAIKSFERVLTSSRVSDDYREKTRNVIETIKEYQKELEKYEEEGSEEDLLP